MIHRIPPGTRDVLPDEMRELRALNSRVLETWQRAGYGEVWTPTLEYEDVMRRGDERAGAAGFRTFDDHGNVLSLRADGTIPIARLVANRYEHAEGPIRLCYFAHAYRAVKVRSGQPREFLQGGMELIGVPAPAGDAEVIALTLQALDAAGLKRHRLGLGDGALYGNLLKELEVPDPERTELLEILSRRDLVGVETRVRGLGLSEAACDLLVRLPTLRGGPEVLDRADGPVARAVEGLRELYELLSESGVADRVIFDLGLVRDLGYYTGVVFEVYDPAVGFAVGGGGRYDELLGRFGKPRPACGVALDIHRVHVAQLEEERQAT
ncbi:MAG: phosphoribosyltransferase regulatory subunit [Thermoleophilaceae bacterium]|jgi:ATP phosphoribosyltransferase regulatory subunit|nr:phosphoribosyltransferase regulatory subunit [Thermoleophilaceae bacterium]